MSDDPPDWLSHWLATPLPRAEALARFDALPPVPAGEVPGLWQGRGLATGHPLDGLLEGLGWYGKRFHPDGAADPLLFRTAAGITALDPRLMPVALAHRLPALAKSTPIRAAFRLLRPVLATRRPAARLDDRAFRGRTSAAMRYDHLPITDHFRRIDATRLLGLMDRQGDPRPYFFLLTRKD